MIDLCKMWTESNASDIVVEKLGLEDVGGGRGERDGEEQGEKFMPFYRKCVSLKVRQRWQHFNMPQRTPTRALFNSHILTKRTKKTMVATDSTLNVI